MRCAEGRETQLQTSDCGWKNTSSELQCSAGQTTPKFQEKDRIKKQAPARFFHNELVTEEIHPGCVTSITPHDAPPPTHPPFRPA